MMRYEVFPRVQHLLVVEREREDPASTDDRHDVSLSVQLKLRVDAEVVLQGQRCFVRRTSSNCLE